MYSETYTHTPKITVPNTKESSEVWWLEPLFHKSDRGIWITVTWWVGYDVILEGNSNYKWEISQ